MNDFTSMVDTQRRRRGHAFLPTGRAWAAIPGEYATESTPVADKTIHLHYFVGGCDWWIAEAWREDTAEGPVWMGFGYARLASHPAGAECGRINLSELERLRVSDGLAIVERDLAWQPAPARDGVPDLDVPDSGTVNGDR